MKPGKVGKIDDAVISILRLSLDPDTPIFLGKTNIENMKKEHPEVFAKYGKKIPEILNNPDYVAKHPRKDSIQYIKIYYDEEKQENVLVALRASARGICYARSIYTITDEKFNVYQSAGTLKKFKRK
ncbi:PBECR2 nuclease fold domain-containing protein [Caldibacillus thermoamylovorans]|nr:PBECR2 nuclease fold domain-containing protein [Caldibacillus thermoamylovorans]